MSGSWTSLNGRLSSLVRTRTVIPVLISSDVRFLPQSLHTDNGSCSRLCLSALLWNTHRCLAVGNLGKWRSLIFCCCCVCHPAPRDWDHTCGPERTEFPRLLCALCVHGRLPLSHQLVLHSDDPRSLPYSTAANRRCWSRCCCKCVLEKTGSDQWAGMHPGVKLLVIGI